MTASVSPHGRDVLLNTVATMSKVAQALNTPESKRATAQFFETVQSVIDFFASQEGRRVINTTGECVNQLCEVAASPESSIFLAEVATNILHAVEVEGMKEEEAQEGPAEEPSISVTHAEDTETSFVGESKPLMSPMSCVSETTYETESNFSEAVSFAQRPSDVQQEVRGRTRRSSLGKPEAAPRAMPKRAEKRAVRSARIEKEVLLKMGVDPAMIGEIQRILDVVTDTGALQTEDDEEDDQVYAADEDDDNASISFAFGTRTAVLGAEEETKQDAPAVAAEDVILPEWHEEPMREALRRRHAQAEAAIHERDAYETQAREMAAVLAKRRIAHEGQLDPADLMACRVITQVMTYGLAMLLLLAAMRLLL